MVQKTDGIKSDAVWFYLWVYMCGGGGGGGVTYKHNSLDSSVINLAVSQNTHRHKETHPLSRPWPWDKRQTFPFKDVTRDISTLACQENKQLDLRYVFESCVVTQVKSLNPDTFGVYLPSFARL